MKKIKILSFLFCVATLLAACHDDEECATVPQPREQVGRTVLVYLVGDNGANDLSGLLRNNFKDMKEGMEQVDYSKCNLVVYSEMRNDVPHLISLKKQKDKVVADTLFTYEEQNPLDKRVMSRVISQAIDYFPADSYGFVFLSHSASWIPATSDANTRSIGDYRSTQMNIQDFHSTLVSSFPKPLKFILFDSCLMQSVEVAYELRDCAEYIIGSPTEIPGPGAPYAQVVPEFFTDLNLAKNIASAYFDEYNAHYTGIKAETNGVWTGGVSLSAIRCEALDELAFATRKVFSLCAGEGINVLTEEIQRYDWSSKKANYDLNDFIAFLVGVDSDVYSKWKKAFDEIFEYWRTTPQNYSIFKGLFSMEKASGISIYIPAGIPNPAMNEFYSSLQWYSAAGLGVLGW